MEDMLDKFYKNKKILLTGITGFKGSWLAIWLKSMGAEVKGVGLKPKSKRDLFNICKLNKVIDTEFIDIQDYRKISAIIKKFKPEIIFHLAGQSIVSTSYTDTLLTYRTNVIGTCNILESCRNLKSIKSIVCITSDKCYENVEKNEGYKETDRLGGTDPYSASKAAMEMVVNSYYKSFFKHNKINVASARAGNVIGGGDWSDNRLVPDCIKSLSKDNKIFLRDPYSNRPWQHILDLINGYLTLGMKNHKNNKFVGAWNFGNSEKKIYTTLELAKQIIIIWGKGKIYTNKKKKFFEHKKLQLNISKARKKLNWRSKLDIKESINWTTMWYIDVIKNNKNPLQLCFNQISDFKKI